MAKRTLKINIKLPTGITANKELEAKVTEAANAAVADAVKDLVETQKLADELAAKGIQISAQELLSRKSGTKGRKAPAKRSSAGPRKRVVLSDNAREKLIGDLKAGMKIRVAAEKYGVSTATVSGIKTKAGLIKKK
ncbi:MAG: hypothetical protein ACNA77_06655 [Opitutales bacterium]